MAKPKSPIKTVTNPVEEFYITVGEGSNLNVEKSNSAAEEFGAVYRSQGSLWGTDFSNLTDNLSARPGLTRDHYEQYRGGERIPKNHKEIVKFAQKAYENVGLVRNIIDLMGDFACQGIRISCTDKRDERFYRKWFEKVSGKERSERFLNNLYRTGNVIIRRQTAKIDQKTRTKYFKADGKPDVKMEKVSITKAEIPWRYIYFNPCSVDLLGEGLACFADKKQYVLTVPTELRSKINSGRLNAQEADLVKNLPSDIVNAIKNNGHYLLPPDKTLVFHYKKDDWQPWALPMIHAIFTDILLYEKHKLADFTALDGATSNFRIWKLGHIGNSPAERIMPGRAAASKLREIIGSQTAGGTVDIVWDAAIDLLESRTEVYKFLGEEKYKPTLDAIHGGLGIPSTLVGSGGGTTNNLMSLQTLIQRLEYGRGVLLDFWHKELEILKSAIGLKQAYIEFDYMDLGDPAAQHALLIQLSDRGLMSDELIQEKFKHIPALEEARLQRENAQRQTGERAPKAGPFFEGEPDEQIKKLAVQKGYLTPKQVGMDADKLGQQIQNMDKTRPKTATKPGQPQQGRPKNSRDTVKRKTKRFVPKTKASLELWASQAQDKIAEIVNPAILAEYNKKNMRSLTTEQAQAAENIKFGVLFSIEPFSPLTKDLIAQAMVDSINLSPAIYSSFKKMYTDAREDLGRELTFDEIRQIQRYLYGEIYNEDSD